MNKLVFNLNDILLYLVSAKEIEHILTQSYRKIEYPFNKRGVHARNLPLFNKELYDLIKNFKRLPTAKEFEDHYLNKYLTRPSNKVALRYHTNIAYKGLVSDLHFYFILKESGLFEDIKMNYLYDLEAKTDILIRKNGKTIGLQLFNGDKNYRLSKEKSIKQLQLGYELILYNLRDNLERKKVIEGADDSKIVLYGRQDANFISEYLIDTSSLTPEESMIDELTDEFTLLTNNQIHSEESTVDENVQYSYVYIGTKSKDIKQYLTNLRRQGKKVLALFRNKAGDTFTITDGETFTLNGRKLDRTDGLLYLKKHSGFFKEFNFYQFIIEHASHEYNIAVNAGAGSGKTTTLVSRILYLLFTKRVNSLHEIVMITFTNEAASNMKEALEKRLEELYRKTGIEAHYKFIQQVRFMKIVTIPAFANDILNQFSHHIGFSSKINITDMVLKRREVLENCLDQALSTHSINPFGRLDYHKIVDFLENVWDKFNQKGIIEQELMNYLELNPDDDLLKLTVVQILKNAEEQFTRLKFDEDFVTVADLTRFLKLLIDQQVPLQELNKYYKYLLVDEFQDTDIAQIQFIATITAKAKLHLTVVGDTKQSVYRFRGADSTAFTVLNDYLIKLNYNKLHNYQLNENFRSTNKLIEEMENIFSVWRKQELLPPKEQPMYSRKDNYLDEKQIFKLYQDDFSLKYLIDEFVAMPTEKEKANILAVLVRNNYEAEAIGRKLRKLEKGPRYEVQTEGTLYTSKSARDLGILLHSWLHAKSDPIMQNQALYSLSETAFCKKEKSIQFLIDKRYQNRHQKYPTSFISADDFSFKVPKAWYIALEQMKEKPTLPILQEFLEISDYVTNLESDGYNEIDTIKYDLNLEKILTEIYEHFSNNATLIQIYDWLKLQILTNRESDEAEIEESNFEGNFIRVMTVHKSKGLQFHTVLIPYPKNAFIRKEDEITKDLIIQIGEQYELMFGWKYYDKTSGFKDVSSIYSSLRNIEDKEVRQEETRILYVAMTRAEHSLKIYGLKDTLKGVDKPNNWGELLLM